MAPIDSSTPDAELPARDRILSAAVRLFADDGMAATGISAILEASGTGKGQFYHYFGSKQGLIDEVLAGHARAEVDRIRTSFEGRTALDGLRVWLADLHDRETRAGFRGGCPIAAIAAEAPEDDLEFRDRIALAFDAQLEALADGLEAGARADGGEARSGSNDPLALAMRILLLVQGGLLLSSTLKEPAFLEEASRASIEAAAAAGYGSVTHRP